MIAIPNIPKPKEAVNVEVIFRSSEGYIVGHIFDMPLIEIDDEIWEALKPKVETMSMALKGWVDDSNADQDTQHVESVEQEEWIDWREEQEFEDRWERSRR